MRYWILGLTVAGCGGDDPGDKTPPTDTTDPTTDLDLDDDGFEAPEDCDDADPSVYPGAPEVPYDGIDQDCADGDAVDLDDDGFAAIEAGGDDCDDADAGVNPSAGDSVGDGVDDNCDGVDGVDADGDGIASRVSGGDDCDDTDPTVFPGAPEVWYDGVDQDCARDCDWDADADGAVQPGFTPGDGTVCDLDPAVGVVSAPEDCDEADPLATFQALLGSTPIPGAANVSPQLPLSATLTTPDPAAMLLVTDPSGAQVPGLMVLDGAQLTFTPTDPLAEDTTYDAFVVHACGTESWSFTTRGPPGGLDPSLVGRVWAADLSVADWRAPPGLGPLLVPFVDRTWWIQALEVAPGAGELLLAPVSGATQLLCSETVRMPIDQLVPGAVTVAGPLDATFPAVGGIPWTPRALVASGEVAADGAALTRVSLTYWVDTVPLVPLIAPGGADDAICALIAAFGVACSLCPDGSSDWCVDAELGLPDLPEVSGVSPVERTAADIAADPACP